MDEVQGSVSQEQLDSMLEEVSGYLVELEPDPTLAHLGSKYLQERLSKARNYTNRVMFYLQKCMRYEKSLRVQIKQKELDLEFKLKEKLADDVLVRKQPSISDRQALATTMLKDEYAILAEHRVVLIDVEETVKMLKMKYSDLQRTMGDIKTQRGMVKDDKMAQMHGDEGYDKPVINRDRSVPRGMPAPVPAEPINPEDLLDAKKRPDDLPEPRDREHAQLIGEFLQRHPEKTKQNSESTVAIASGTVVETPNDNTPSIQDSEITNVVDYSSLLS